MDIGKDTQFKSGAKAAECGRKGGIASGKAKRKKASMRDMAQAILDGTFSDKNGTQFTGMELIQRGLMQNLSNPEGKNWAKAMDLLVTLTSAGMSPEQRENIRATTAKIKAEVKAMQGTGEQHNGMLEQLIKGLQDDVHTETESPDADVANGETQTPESS